MVIEGDTVELDDAKNYNTDNTVCCDLCYSIDVACCVARWTDVYFNFLVCSQYSVLLFRCLIHIFTVS